MCRRQLFAFVLQQNCWYVSWCPFETRSEGEPSIPTARSRADLPAGPELEPGAHTRRHRGAWARGPPLHRLPRPRHWLGLRKSVSGSATPSTEQRGPSLPGGRARGRTARKGWPLVASTTGWGRLRRTAHPAAFENLFCCIECALDIPLNLQITCLDAGLSVRQYLLSRRGSEDKFPNTRFVV